MTPDILDSIVNAQSAMGYLFYMDRDRYVELLEDFHNMLLQEEAKEIKAI